MGTEPDPAAMAAMREMAENDEGAGPPADTVEDLVGRLADVRWRLDDLKKQKEDLEGQERDLNARIRDLLDEHQARNLKTTSGVTVYVNDRTFYRVNAPDRGRLIRWLDDIGEGHMAQRTVSSATLGKFIAARLDAGEPIPEFIKASEKRQAGLRGIGQLVADRADTERS